MTALNQKYAQVSDGCWRNPTAVQVGVFPFRPRGVTGALGEIDFVVWQRVCVYVGGKKKKNPHACRRTAAYVCFSNFKHKELRVKRGRLHCTQFLTVTHVICSLSMAVCQRDGPPLVGLPYHANRFSFSFFLFLFFSPPTSPDV